MASGLSKLASGARALGNGDAGRTTDRAFSDAGRATERLLSDGISALSSTQHGPSKEIVNAAATKMDAAYLADMILSSGSDDKKTQSESRRVFERASREDRDGALSTELAKLLADADPIRAETGRLFGPNSHDSFVVDYSAGGTKKRFSF